MINQFLSLLQDQFLVRDSLDVLRYGIQGFCSITGNICTSLGCKGPCLFKRGHFHFIALRIVGAVDALSDNGSRAQYPYRVDLKRRKRIEKHCASLFLLQTISEEYSGLKSWYLFQHQYCWALENHWHSDFLMTHVPVGWTLNWLSLPSTHRTVTLSRQSILLTWEKCK